MKAKLIIGHILYRKKFPEFLHDKMDQFSVQLVLDPWLDPQLDSSVLSLLNSSLARKNFCFAKIFCYTTLEAQKKGDELKWLLKWGGYIFKSYDSLTKPQFHTNSRLKLESIPYASSNPSNACLSHIYL